MIVSFKDSVKFFAVSIMACCAVFVCNMFLNYTIDFNAIGDLVSGDQMEIAYKAVSSNNKVVCLVSGGCLLLTSVVTLIFYISQYIQANSRKLGVIKAMGYSNEKIARSFAVFGLSVFIGAAIGYGASWAILPEFYVQQAANNVLPEVTLHFHAWLAAVLVLLPSLAFALLSYIIALIKLNRPVMRLIRGDSVKPLKNIKEGKENTRSFLLDMSLGMLGQGKALTFFIAFGGFCFSAMTQMGLSMKDYASEMMGAIMISIGLVLAATSLYLAMTTVVGANKKSIAMMKALGYGKVESGFAVLGFYHIPSYIGFILGAVYQWGLLNVMVNVVFRDYENIKPYAFDWELFGICLAIYFVIYELLNVVYTLVISKTSLKCVMEE